ncbi:MAG: ferritin-like protein [Alphaproteobacteria bacterium]|nr:ferritin-like protein [Alphaproteobacteria bacterium]
MLKIDPRYIAEVDSCDSAHALYPVLQRAVELEHATIPPYLTAFYSLKPGLNDQIAALIREVIIEEMLHMTIAANVLISLGGGPIINRPRFVPSYPGGLPMGIGGRDFIVGIEAFSLRLVRDTFMRIEEPEHPIEVGTEADAGGADLTPPSFRTIGEFYTAIQRALRRIPASSYGNVDRQVLGVFGRKENFAIRNAKTAVAAIQIIKDQGEGTRTDPFEADGDPAHYYRFGEIYAGNRLIRVGRSYKYLGDPVPFVQEGVFPMRPNPTPDQFPEGSYGRVLSDNFTEGYSTLLNALHVAFNGHPARMKDGMGLMYQLRFMAQKLMSTPLPDCPQQTGGPVYRYKA